MFNRNDPLGLVERTKKNLQFIEDAAQHGDDVHVVTQLILSLLGLIVFPIESHGFDKDIRNTTLSSLEHKGWPKWDTAVGTINTLGELLRNLRNAAAHNNISFSSEGRELGDVRLTFSNRYNKKAPIHWQASIEAKDLRAFCDQLIFFIMSG